MKKISRNIEEKFVTIVFAEAGEFDTARDFRAVGVKDRKKPDRCNLSWFRSGMARKRSV